MGWLLPGSDLLTLLLIMLIFHNKIVTWLKIVLELREDLLKLRIQKQGRDDSNAPV
jgi:hypothetical protein